MSAITTHVLDTAKGRPAEGLTLTLERHDASGDWELLSRGVTDADGRVRDLLPDSRALDAGVYRLTFETAGYFRATGVQGFYPSVPVVFELRSPGEHYHVPLLLSPFGYTTYRGS